MCELIFKPREVLIMKTITTLSSAIALSFAMNAAIAGPNHGKMVAEFDVDKDGSITRAEVDQVLSEKFATADTDGDGMLTTDEMSTAHEQRKQQHISERFAEIDVDGDGSLNLEEFQAGKPASKRRHRFSGEHVGERFAEIDIDGNDSLSLEEFQTGKPAGCRGKRHGRNPEKMFSRLDQDGDELLSKTELDTPLLRMFERLDSNQDDVVSAEEMNQAPFHRGGGRHHGNGRQQWQR